MKKINLQFLISYFGILPYFLILLDLYLFNFFHIIFLKDLLFFYTLLIFTYIGAMRWSYNENINFIKIIYGFLPSLISIFLISISLLDYNKNYIFISIIFFLSIQLICDFYIINNKFEKLFFLYVRFPFVIIISVVIYYSIFV